MIAVAALIILPAVLFNQQKNDEVKKDKLTKIEQDKRDSIQRRNYDSSLLIMKLKFDSSNFKTNSIISENLGKYGYKFDSANNRIVKMIKDSSKTKIIVGDDPVVNIESDGNIKGIEIKSIRNKEYYLAISLKSNDAGSSSFEIKYSFVCEDTMGYLFYHYNSIPIGYSSAIGKDQYMESFSSIYPVSRPHFIYIWARGKYKNIDKTKSYFLAQVYYYNTYGNTFGMMQGNTREKIIEKVKLHED